MAKPQPSSSSGSLLKQSEVTSKSKEILRQFKIKRTHPRLRILLSLFENTGPRTAEEVFHSVKNADLVTVYRTLELFVERGVARQIRFKDAPIRYELCLGHHHHHIVCTTCGVVDELPECDLKAIQDALLKTSKSFSAITDHSLEFFGSCRACSTTV